MSEDIKKLVEVCMDPAMTGEGRVSVLAYARGRLDAQRAFKRMEFKRQMLELLSAEAEKPSEGRKDY
jgi:hypothetical protein